MFVRIQQIQSKKLIGQSVTTSFANDQTFRLWRNFMPRRNEIKNAESNDLYAMQVYPTAFSFAQIDPEKPFEKYAAVAVTNDSDLPDGMQLFDLPAGLYAVFLHKGSASDGERTFRYIFTEWIPQSDYVIDARPHFEILGEKYKNDDPDSEEEIYIPIKRK